MILNQNQSIQNKNEKGETKIGNSINQSNGSYLIKDKDLKKLIKHYLKLKEEIEQTDQLINSKLKIQTIEKFDEILNEISKLGYV